jgi:hypothetical protein
MLDAMHRTTIIELSANKLTRKDHIMRFCPYYQSAAIRLDYSQHVLRSMVQGFVPMSFDRFANQFARSFYLVGRVGPMI